MLLFLNFKTFQRPFIYPIKAGFYRDGVVHFLSNEPNTKNSIDKAEETPSASEDPRAAPARQAQDFRRGGQVWRMSSRGSPGASQGSELASSGHGRGGGGQAGSGARLWSCSDWRSLGFYSAVPSSKGPFLSSNSLFISQNHNFFGLLVFCCNVCKHRYRTLVLVLRVFDDAEALLT